MFSYFLQKVLRVFRTKIILFKEFAKIHQAQVLLRMHVYYIQALSFIKLTITFVFLGMNAADDIYLVKNFNKCL